MAPAKLITDVEALIAGPNEMPFPKFSSIARLNRDVVITEKIDGTNALIEITRVPLGTSIEFSIPPFIRAWIDDTEFDESGMPKYELILRAGSRTRWISPEDDNFNFAKWVKDNAHDLLKLGVGKHYGEWYGQGIQRNYGLTHKRFALFNVAKWGDPESRPTSCDVVPVLARVNGSELSQAVEREVRHLRDFGSVAVPGFRNPEGVVVFHTAASQLFKVTLENDEVPKSLVKPPTDWTPV